MKLLNEKSWERDVDRSHQPQATGRQLKSSHTAPSLDGLRVLLAEDCVDQGRLYLKFLQTAGAEVTLECNGQSAVDAVRKSPDVFDAVVMDFQMPEMDGLDATRQLRILGYEGPVIAVTAFASTELKLSWQQAGCNEFLQKPLEKTELISAVARHATTSLETIGT